MNYSQEIGNNIRVIREIKGLTQKHMASELDMSVSGYNKIERGESDVSLTRLNEIAKTLGTDISKIIRADNSYFFNFTNNENANGIVQNQYVANTEEMRSMLSMIQAQLDLLHTIIKK